MVVMPSSFLTALGAHVLVEASPCIKPATSSTSNRVTYACMCVCVCVCALASDSRKHMSVWLRHVCAPRKCEEGVAVHLLHDLPLLPRPPRAPRLAPPIQDFQGVRARFKEGCLDRLRRCGHYAHKMMEKGCKQCQISPSQLDAGV